VAVGGSLAEKPGHLSARLGAQISALIPAVAKNGQKVRYIAGGVFRGYQTRPDSFLGLRETSLLAVPEADRKEFFGFARPGYEKQSYSRTFLSHFRKVPFDIDCSLHGEERACINCGYCAEVCAVDILPQFLLKTILAEAVEEALAHGMLDCVSCGLCTYVCPSKINIRDRIEKAKTEYYHEIYS
jgi:Na+-transporting NADH:ubiquinone oxidoreductase subunit A